LEDKVFSIIPSNGELGKESHLKLKVAFNPYSPGTFKKTIPLLIGDSDKPYLDLQISGSSAYPRLTFDRTEIIMPTVPLNIASKCVFRILNDGYENTSLSCKVPSDFTDVKLEVRFQDGQILGVTKSK